MVHVTAGFTITGAADLVIQIAGSVTGPLDGEERSSFGSIALPPETSAAGIYDAVRAAVIRRAAGSGVTVDPADIIIWGGPQI